MLTFETASNKISDETIRQVRITYWLMFIVLPFPQLAPLLLVFMALKPTPRLIHIQNNAIASFVMSHYQHQLLHLSVYTVFLVVTTEIYRIGTYINPDFKAYIEASDGLGFFLSVMFWVSIVLFAGGLIKGVDRFYREIHA